MPGATEVQGGIRDDLGVDQIDDGIEIHVVGGRRSAEGFVENALNVGGTRAGIASHSAGMRDVPRSESLSDGGLEHAA